MTVRRVGKYLYLDSFVQTLGSTAYQAIHQRILSTATLRTARICCFAAAFSPYILATPSILIGAVAASTGETCCSKHSFGRTNKKKN